MNKNIKEHRTVIKKKAKDNDVFENNINIKIDLKDINPPVEKEKKKKRRVKKKKPINPEDLLKSGANPQSSSMAPKPFGSAKIPSSDTLFNPNNITNSFIAGAIQNALTRPMFNNIPLQPPILPSQAQTQTTQPTPTQQNIVSTAPQAQASSAQAQSSGTLDLSRANSYFPSAPSFSFPSIPALNWVPQSSTLITPFTSPLAKPQTQQQQQQQQPQQEQDAMYLTLPEPAKQPIQKDLLRYEMLLRKANLTPEESLELNNLNLLLDQTEKKVIDDKIKLTSPSRPIQGRILQFTPEVGEWNKALLDLFEKNKGKASYTQIKENPDMIKYADDLADHLLKTNPDVEKTIRRAIENPSSRKVGDLPDGYKAYLKFLNSVVPESDVFPYYYAKSKEASKFKQMFYERFKLKVFNQSERLKIAIDEKQQEIDDIP